MEKQASKEENSIPIVDISELENANESTLKDLGDQIASAFEDIGFVYLENHGIPKDIIEKAHEVGLSFFRLPQEVKKLYTFNLAINHGYTAINQERLDKHFGRIELKESYNFSDVDGTNGGFYPTQVPDLQPVVKTLHSYGRRLARKLIGALDAFLEVDGFLTKAHGAHLNYPENCTNFRLLHYPPVPENDPKKYIRCGTHTDYGSFTLIFQDEIGGLEVKRRSGDWVKAKPINNTILVNVSDFLQIWTNGRFKATEHRVLIPEEELSIRKSRSSIALFIHPKRDILIRPIDGPTSYPSILAADHLHHSLRNTY